MCTPSHYNSNSWIPIHYSFITCSWPWLGSISGVLVWSYISWFLIYFYFLYLAVDHGFITFESKIHNSKEKHSDIPTYWERSLLISVPFFLLPLDRNIWVPVPNSLAWIHRYLNSGSCFIAPFVVPISTEMAGRCKIPEENEVLLLDHSF